MTDTLPTTPVTITPLAEALALTAVHLPRRSRSYTEISHETALEAAASLTRTNHPENEVLASLTWLLPEDDAMRPTPDYLRPTLEKLQRLWEPTLRMLGTPAEERNPLVQTLVDTPQPARIILAVYLLVLLEQGADLIMEGRKVPQDASFYRNFLTVAEALSHNAPDLTGSRLMAEVRYQIGERRLKPELLPEEVKNLVWVITARDELSEPAKRDALDALQYFLHEFWLTIGTRKTDEYHFYLLARETDEIVPSLDRFMTSIAVRFDRLFQIERTDGRNLPVDIRWRLAFIDHWHMGLRYDGRHKALLGSPLVDPFTQFVRGETVCTAEEQLAQIRRIRERIMAC